ncbi:MAG: glycosyltransferase family 2 protein [Sphingomonadales bacterium]|nr:glycosyltransferase family 2 protein [Sphingomonadales bacterium]
MGVGFSIVVICKNDAAALSASLETWLSITKEVILYDTGSTDETQELVKNWGVTLHRGEWEGFGRTKNKASQLASNDWILSLDADEVPDPILIKSLLSWTPPHDKKVVYNLRFINFYKNQPVRFGEWGWDFHVRLFNRNYVTWNEAMVHEKLQYPNECKVLKLKGHVLHRTVSSLEEYKEKTIRYAKLSAKKYYSAQKKASWIKLYLSPPFTFVLYYFIKLGFLDGKAGLLCAYMTTRYTYLKYRYLKKLQHNIALPD